LAEDNEEADVRKKSRRLRAKTERCDTETTTKKSSKIGKGKNRMKAKEESDEKRTKKRKLDEKADEMLTDVLNVDSSESCVTKKAKLTEITLANHNSEVEELAVSIDDVSEVELIILENVIKTNNNISNNSNNSTNTRKSAIEFNAKGVAEKEVTVLSSEEDDLHFQPKFPNSNRKYPSSPSFRQAASPKNENKCSLELQQVFGIEFDFSFDFGFW
jgi:hypothetical protein